jgi:hypothetical protein
VTPPSPNRAVFLDRLRDWGAATAQQLASEHELKPAYTLKLLSRMEGDLQVERVGRVRNKPRIKRATLWAAK